jgi:choline dehydrogenase-like flavoprotein
MTGIDGPSFDRDLDAVAQRIHVSTTEGDVNANNDALRRGCVALGLRQGSDWDVIPRNAVGCQGRCGFCTFGCPYAARQSGSVTFLLDALRGGARLYASTRAEYVETVRGRVTGVRGTFREGEITHQIHLRARAVVVAGGALQTPALLLRSGIRHAGVGAGLRLDPTTALAGEFSTPVRTWVGPPQTIGIYRFQTSDPGAHGPWIEAAPAHPGLSAIALPWGGAADFRRLMERTEHVATPIVLVRDVGEGRVSIDTEGRPRFEYVLTPRDRANLVRGVVETARLLRAAGATRLLSLQTQYAEVGDGTRALSEGELDRFVEEVERVGIWDNAAALFSAHPIGSARAGLDPRTSAASPSGEVHGIEGLWIGDGSLLPSAPGVNPMLSILAVARRTAGRLVDRLGAG